jgi:hypothetical protein
MRDCRPRGRSVLGNKLKECSVFFRTPKISRDPGIECMMPALRTLTSIASTSDKCSDPYPVLKSETIDACNQPVILSSCPGIRGLPSAELPGNDRWGRQGVLETVQDGIDTIDLMGCPHEWGQLRFDL